MLSDDGPTAVPWDECAAVLFDLDGVLTPTAEVHMRAWAELFAEVLDDYPDQPPYSDADYFAHVDGRPRYDGVRELLTARGITLPEGDPGDEPTAWTVCGLGNRKNTLFTELLERDGVSGYPGSLALLDHLREHRLPLAVVSSSANAPAVLRAAGLTERFAYVVCGAVARNQQLQGKPAPDTFLHAAAQLGAAPQDTVVVEDATSGVRAGVAGGFGLVVGVDRGARDALHRAGAHRVVADLAELLPDGPVTDQEDSR